MPDRRHSQQQSLNLHVTAASHVVSMRANLPVRRASRGCCRGQNSSPLARPAANAGGPCGRDPPFPASGMGPPKRQPHHAPNQMQAQLLALIACPLCIRTDNLLIGADNKILLTLLPCPQQQCLHAWAVIAAHHVPHDWDRMPYACLLSPSAARMHTARTSSA